ncbi:MAG: hypothetical protein GWO16_11720 [Gammaproteobacteria bacterium]|nr:hypothetical protein [Gammaproteobacteria bacterium]NIR98596.1 hypothetical protein [Gammaproteobacteria bacterium]NIT64319.1 hypothetical protein [Gammaproteobacteria bacterium]NIV21243.1 hypothetical protein [Gammaproteobacteria bacterium]NIX10947.1 hypothetical protein [Gammaproteobacteria bacterium]
MTAQERSSPSPRQPEAPEGGLRVPAAQRLLDDPYFLLLIGIAVPTAIYLVWHVA